MDSVRVYDRYITARIRSERLITTELVLHSPVASEYPGERLAAGGRLSSSFKSMHFFKSKSKKQEEDEVTSESQQLTLLQTKNDRYKSDKSDKGQAKDDNTLKDKSKKWQCKALKCPCKPPIIIVRSKSQPDCEPDEDALPLQRFRHSPLVRGTGRADKPTCDEANPLKATESPRVNTLPSPVSEECIPVRGGPSTLHCPLDVSHRCECYKVPEIAEQVQRLNKRLENQIAYEALRKLDLDNVNDQLKELVCSVKSLHEKYDELQAVQTNFQDALCCRQLDSPGDLQVANKCSSLCQFCKYLDLPVLNSIYCRLHDMMGKRSYSDIALSILLRADNVYHLNVRDLRTGCIIGCMLASNTAIIEANYGCLFKEVLTFCVTDVRNTLCTTADIAGGINFEYVRGERLAGGAAPLSPETASSHFSVDNANSNPSESPCRSDCPFHKPCMQKKLAESPRHSPSIQMNLAESPSQKPCIQKLAESPRHKPCVQYQVKAEQASSAGTPAPTPRRSRSHLELTSENWKSSSEYPQTILTVNTRAKLVISSLTQQSVSDENVSRTVCISKKRLYQIDNDLVHIDNETKYPQSRTPTTYSADDFSNEEDEDDLEKLRESYISMVRRSRN